MWKRLAEQDDNSRQSNNEEIQKFMDILSSKRHQEIMELLAAQNNKIDSVYKHFMACLMDENCNVKLELKCSFCFEVKLSDTRHGIHECPHVQRVKRKWKCGKEAILIPPSTR